VSDKGEGHVMKWD